MSSSGDYLLLLHYLYRLILKKNINLLTTIVLLNYLILKLKRLKEMNVQLIPLSDSTFNSIIKKYYQREKFYVDAGSCALGTLCDDKLFNANWINICNVNSDRKFKLFLVPFDDAPNDGIYVSETLLSNIKNLLKTDEQSTYFLMRADKDEDLKWADRIKISMIANPIEVPDDLIRTLLNNYFSSPRYLRKDDIIHIYSKEYAPDVFIIINNPQLLSLYFKVNEIRIDGENSMKPCYVLRNLSTLIQESNICEYLPSIYRLPLIDDSISSVKVDIDQNNVDNFPFLTYTPFDQLRASILPFMMSDNWRRIKPIFLLKGPSGSGKYSLIKSISERMGFHFFNIDCSEIQTSSPSQTEAKIRIALSNIENCVPSIIKLSNIQIFGKNPEGKIDERVTANFTEQLSNLYERKMKLPLIIIATSESDDLPVDLNRNFIEEFKINYLTQHQRIDLFEWFLKIHKIKYNADLTKISSMCSDFLYKDIENLTLRAIKNSRRRIPSVESLEECFVDDSDFVKAYDYMQSTFCDRMGAPKCPEVYWDDIGGLSSLKHEIIRRIEIPLVHGFGVQTSGILLYGPPGTGKTLLAKAVATECKLNFLSVKGPELLNMYVGQSEKNVRDLFERAQAASPCIIFFDELDALAPNRGRSGDSGGVMDRVVSQLLAEMDGLNSSAKTFIIGATNRPDLIDPALLRPGRFDKLLYVGIYSDAESQLSVLKAITRKFNMTESSAELDKVVGKLPDNLTGADLHALCSNAWLNAVQRVIHKYETSLNDNRDDCDIIKKPEGPVTVTLDDFLDAIQTLVPSVSKDELNRYEKLHRELTSKKSNS